MEPFFHGTLESYKPALPLFLIPYGEKLFFDRQIYWPSSPTGKERKAQRNGVYDTPLSFTRQTQRFTLYAIVGLREKAFTTDGHR